jgi:hypothetical protein
VRRWICPLCRKRCLKIKVDNYFDEVLQYAKDNGEDITKVFFLEDGSFTFEEYESQGAKTNHKLALDNKPYNSIQQAKFDKSKAEKYSVMSITDDEISQHCQGGNIEDLGQDHESIHAYS